MSNQLPKLEIYGVPFLSKLDFHSYLVPAVRGGYLQIPAVRGGHLQIPAVRGGYLQIPIVRARYLLNTSACFSKHPLVG